VQISAEGTRNRYEVVIAGARVAGSATALLLARAGLDVLVVDPVPRGRDTLSTHALMRGAVLQLSRWGLLDAIRAEGTPLIDSTSFHYGTETIRVPIKAEGDIEGLFAPRRTVLDRVIADAAETAGAHFLYGASVSGLKRDSTADEVSSEAAGQATATGQPTTGSSSRVIGVTLTQPGHAEREISCDLVIGADGMHSRVGRLVGSKPVYEVPHATASIYGYWPGLEVDGFHWHFDEHLAFGRIPTNDGETCVFASLPPARLMADRDLGLERIFHDTIRAVAPDFAALLSSIPSQPKLRGFAGSPSLLREAAGPGWALVGDAGYFKDPLTAHGITDALRDTEILSRAVISAGGDPVALDQGLNEYQSTRDALSHPLLDVTSRIASLEWSLDEVKDHHMELSRAMSAEVDHIRAWNSRCNVNPPNAVQRR